MSRSWLTEAAVVLALLLLACKATYGIAEVRDLDCADEQTMLQHACRLGEYLPSAAESPLYALPTYTAMLSLRELLVARGEAGSAWS